MNRFGYNDGYLERKSGGKYEGEIIVDGVELSPIEGVYFTKGNKQYLWLKRKPLLEYNPKQGKFVKRDRKPKWETYLEKQMSDEIAYRGDFFFLRVAYSIVGIWDGVLGMEKNRLNLIVERKQMREQGIINAINKRNKNERK